MSRGSREKSRDCAVTAAWEKILRRRGAERAIIEAETGRVRTFRELDGAARDWLAAHAPNPDALAGRVVVFAVRNGSAWLELFLALMRARAIAVPLDIAEPPAAQRRLAEKLRAGFWWDGARLVALARPRRFRDSRAFLIKLTSGTTGEPRRLLCTGAQMIADGQQVTMSMGVRPSDLNYGLIPFGHSYGLGSIVLPLITRGIPVLCGTAALPQAIAADFGRWRPTAFPGVPPVFRALAEADLPRDAFASLRVAISAGAPLPPETARAFVEKFGRRVHAFYGSSETGGIAYDRTGQATLAGSVGTPLRGVRITAGPGQRICICSPAVFTHGNPRRHGSHGCWVPPDRAAIDRRGCITLLGRRGTVVKIAGRRVNLGEIATRLRRVPGVRDVWVGASPGAEPLLGAAVIADRAIADLRAELLADTAAWKIPKRWALLPEFPLTNRGKTDTRALQAAVFK